MRGAGGSLWAAVFIGLLGVCLLALAVVLFVAPGAAAAFAVVFLMGAGAFGGLAMLTWQQPARVIHQLDEQDLAEIKNKVVEEVTRLKGELEGRMNLQLDYLKALTGSSDPQSLQERGGTAGVLMSATGEIARALTSISAKIEELHLPSGEPSPPPIAPPGPWPMAELRQAYGTEQRLLTFAMAPFWYACGNELPAHIGPLAATLPETNGAAARVSGQVEIALGDILRSAVSGLGQESYRTNTALITASFIGDEEPYAQAAVALREAAGELGARIRRNGAPSVREALSEVQMWLSSQKRRLASGDLPYVLPPASFDILDKHKGAASSPEVLAWLLVASGMVKYMEKHYRSRMART